MHFVDLFFNFMLIFTLECIQFANEICDQR